MHSVFSLVFLTTLIGVGQGLFLALVVGFLAASGGIMALENQALLFGGGNFLALLFLLVGLAVSSTHLSHPTRAWRAISQWRTSWLSREVTLLPLFMLLVLLNACGHSFGWADAALLLLGLAGAIASGLLFVCTAMIYAELKFLREWSAPLTVVNFILLGCASGFTLAAAFSSYAAPELITLYSGLAIVLTLCGGATRIATLVSNNKQPGATSATNRSLHGSLQGLSLPLMLLAPVLLLFAGIATAITPLLALAFLLQYMGILLERWLFFDQITHPQVRYQGHFG